MNCPHCKTLLEKQDDKLFCPECGEEFIACEMCYDWKKPGLMTFIDEDGHRGWYCNQCSNWEPDTYYGQDQEDLHITWAGKTA